MANRQPINTSAAEDALEIIAHRGPDAAGLREWEGQVCLGHRRLSIIDLRSESNQPFTYEHLHITFNGEIFNYKELRSLLVKVGFVFRTASDTEVILASYLHWGADCVNHFNGMWAFVIYDQKNHTLFCSRDRFGIKPFNYSFKNGRFCFASEIKALIAFDPGTYRSTNYNAISRFCRETVGAQTEETWFDNVLRLPPAHNLFVSLNGHHFEKYWDYPTEKNRLNYQDAKSEYRSLFESAVRLRLRSDVPIGLTLSGGVDSASIACQVSPHQEKPLQTYTASFPGKTFDEYPVARALSEKLGMNSVEVQLDYSNYVSTLDRIIYHLESGHGSPAIFPLWNITERAKRNITVYLEGQGADELLAGYANSVFVDHFLDLVASGNYQRALGELNSHRKVWPIKETLLLYLRQQLPASWRTRYREFTGLESLYRNELTNHRPYEGDVAILNADSKLNRRLQLQHRNGLVNLLHYGDAISMAHSLENRLPFLDYRLVEFVYALPSEYKISGAIGKKIHRDVMNGSVPDAILKNANKLGFVSPLKEVFTAGSEAVDVLQSTDARQPELFDRRAIAKLLKAHQNGSVNHERILFKLLGTKLWLNRYAQ
ncbi:asparagine synthase (glutamine-hydrolyzing) [Lewinella sp. JB7]|nr:asparagine synthase (glutamine-hydrolyzing) [Lewinella sp. JB7]